MPYRAQSANRLTERIHAMVRSVIERADVSSLLVACSGGADSTCLMHAVATVAQQSGRQLAVCHVRHGVRVDDGRDAEIVRTLAERFDVACHIVSLDLAPTDGGHTPSESEMRDARYRALAGVAADMHSDAVLTGHTLDDQAETVLLHLIRGAGVDGLGGMAEDTLLLRLRIIRPFLSVRREETVAYCTAHNLVIVQDPTNDDQRYTRNWLRHAIFPTLRARNPDISVVLARVASTTRDDAAFLASQTALAMTRCDCRTEDACVSISHIAFASEHVALQRRILREILQRIIGAAPRTADVDALRHHIAVSQSTTLRQFGGVACCLVFDRIILGCDQDVVGWMYHSASERFPLSRGPMTLAEGERVQLTLSEHSVVSYTVRLVAVGQLAQEALERGAMTTLLRLPGGAEITIRYRQPTDRFWPCGSARPLLLRDYLRVRGIPAPVRDLLPLLVVNDTIAWVIGHDVGSAFAATEATATHCGILTRVTGESNERVVETHG